MKNPLYERAEIHQKRTWKLNIYVSTLPESFTTEVNKENKCMCRVTVQSKSHQEKEKELLCQIYSMKKYTEISVQFFLI
jgi:hypothetical protein